MSYRLCTLFIPAMRDTAERKWASGQNGHAKGRTSMRALPLSLSPDRREPPQQRGGFRILGALGERHGNFAACAALLLAQGPPDLSLRGGRRPDVVISRHMPNNRKPSAKSQLLSRLHPKGHFLALRSGRHGPFGASQWHVRRVQRCTSALLPLNSLHKRRSLPVKGHASSVRQQSRQRLRSERRYRRNWCVPF